MDTEQIDVHYQAATHTLQFMMSDRELDYDNIEHRRIVLNAIKHDPTTSEEYRRLAQAGLRVTMTIERDINA